MSKKTVSFFLVLVLALSIMLVGCGSAKPEDNDAEEVTTENEEQADETEATTDEEAEEPIDEPADETVDEPADETPEEPAEDPEEESEESEDLAVGMSMEGDMGRFTLVYRDASLNVSQESGPFKVTVNKIEIITFEPSEEYKETFANKDFLTILGLGLEVENMSSDSNYIYPNQGVLVTNTKERSEGYPLLSDDISGEYVGEDYMKGEIAFFLESAAEDLTELKYIIDRPHDADIEFIGDDIIFELSLQR